MVLPQTLVGGVWCTSKRAVRRVSFKFVLTMFCSKFDSWFFYGFPPPPCRLEPHWKECCLNQQAHFLHFFVGRINDVWKSGAAHFSETFIKNFSIIHDV